MVKFCLPLCFTTFSVNNVFGVRVSYTMKSIILSTSRYTKMCLVTGLPRTPCRSLQSLQRFPDPV